MRVKIACATILMFLATQLFSQYMLDTPDGKRVRLNENRTWEFISSDNPDPKASVIPPNSTAQYIGKFRKVTLWYDPAQWFCDTTKKANTYTWDAVFYSSDFAITGYVIESRLSFPTENLENTIKSQWASQGTITSFKSFTDTINHVPLKRFAMDLLFEGITYTYQGLVYTKPNGSFQFTIGSQKSVYDEDIDKIELLLNGIVEL